MLKFTKLFLLCFAAAASGLLSSSCIMLSDAEVMYNWDRGQEYRMLMVAASYDDVKQWYDDVYYAWDYDEITDEPKWSGNTYAPNNMYSPRVGNYRANYYSIAPGTYTAVCTVEDRYGYGYIDIVANYRITLGEEPRYYEIYFDVESAIAGYYDYSWEQTYSNKTRAKKLVKTIEEEDVTYYILRRTKD